MMYAKIWRHAAPALMLLVVALGAASGTAVSPAAAAATPAPQRYLIQARSAADYDGARAKIVQAGGKIVGDLRPVDLMVATLPANSAQVHVADDPHVAAMIPDGVRRLVRPELQQEFFGKPYSARPQQTVVNVDGRNLPRKAAAPQSGIVVGDPAFDLYGLLWNLERIHAQAAWSVPVAQPNQTFIGIADTGLDYTHKELAGQVLDVVDFTYMEAPYPLCAPTDAYYANSLGAPASDLDFNGHGTWIGGNIAAALDGVGINGIAPNIQLVALKISQWCGSAYDSEILSAFIYAADHNIDIVNISFGGYLNRASPIDNALYRQYKRVVNYAMAHGTLIVTSAGNEHVRLGAGGRVLSHGSLTLPGNKPVDLYGWTEMPGGVPGVVVVAATNNYVAAPASSCDPGTTDGDFPTCKPKSDKHQPVGVNKQNQLAYYSNYGPRIDFAAPGGAPKFNVPEWDRGGTPGFPYTNEGPTGTDTWEAFSITSNWQLVIPCIRFTNAEPQFYSGQCYSTIQGTSMAAPHVSAAFALLASANPALRHAPEALVAWMKTNGARKIVGNMTPPLSASDWRVADLWGDRCTGGYCHLGGLRISDREAYGVGLIDAFQGLPQN